MSMYYRCLLRTTPLMGTLFFGGCFTSAQLVDFGRTEVARVISSLAGQLTQLFLQGALNATPGV